MPIFSLISAGLFILTFRFTHSAAFLPSVQFNLNYNALSTDIELVDSTGSVTPAVSISLSAGTLASISE